MIHCFARILLFEALLLFVRVDALRHIQQFFGEVGTFSCLAKRRNIMSPVSLEFKNYTCTDPERGGGHGVRTPPPLEKSQKYRVS